VRNVRQTTVTEGSSAELVLVCGEKRKHFQLTSGDVCRIGRTPDNTIQLPANRVSRNHAIVQHGNPSTFFIVDLGSRNGTYVNGTRITSSTPLQNGDVISLGGQELLFIQSGMSERPEERPSSPDETIVERPVSEITVAVADICGYTKICQKIGEVRIAEVLHTFNTEGAAVLATLNPWSLKYIGDAVMSIWVNYGPAEKFLFRALRASSELMAIAAGLQERFQLDSPVMLRAAVNVGAASIGNMGSSAAPDHTAIGDTVNKVFRLEECAEQLQADVVLSSKAYKALQGEIDPEKLMVAKEVALKGYANSESVYTLDEGKLRSILKNFDPQT
jgi:adenylate cyclase